MIRKENWQGDFNTFLEDSRHKNFVRGVHDCVMFVCDGVKTITNEDFGHALRGKYKTKKEAFQHVKALGCKDLIELTTKTLGQPLTHTSHAGRGDVVAVKYGDELGLAIVDMTGRRAVTPGQKRLQYYKTEHWLKAWKV